MLSTDRDLHAGKGLQGESKYIIKQKLRSDPCVFEEPLRRSEVKERSIKAEEWGGGMSKRGFQGKGATM